MIDVEFERALEDCAEARRESEDLRREIAQLKASLEKLGAISLNAADALISALTLIQVKR